MSRSVNAAPREELIPEIVKPRRTAEILGRSPVTPNAAGVLLLQKRLSYAAAMGTTSPNGAG
jgi:hypothetical protein